MGTQLRRPALVAILLAGAVGIGLGAGVLWGERRAGVREAPPPPSAAPGSATTTSAASEEPIEITLAPEAVERAGIKTAVAQAGTAATAVTVPGTVMSNAYRDTKVNALVGGVVRQVAVELGVPVMRGQTLAVVFSSELAEAQMKYLSARAMFEADHQKRERTEKLVALGAASRQELEEVRAVHVSRETELAAARQRLLLLGLSPDQVDRLTDPSHVVSEVTVASPADGIVVARSVNPGQVVNAGQELFVVTDLRTVWVIADVYERDLSLVGLGAEAIITGPATPNRALRGRVSYIDPRVDPATRAAKVRVEVPNVDLALRLGMFVTVAFRSGTGQRVTLVPRAAVQAVGERSVVYVLVKEGEGRFSERRVTLGPSAGALIQVVDGLAPGETVVTEGSFFLRAEATRTRSGS